MREGHPWGEMGRERPGMVVWGRKGQGSAPQWKRKKEGSQDEGAGLGRTPEEEEEQRGGSWKGRRTEMVKREGLNLPRGERRDH